MLSYVIRRVLSMIPSLFLASIIVFSFIHFIPGDPAVVMLGDMATPEQVQQLREALGLDRPVYVQYIRWLSGILRGDLGNSIFFHQPVTRVIASRAETSIFIALISMALIALIGIPIGVLSAVKYNSWIDQALSSLSMFFASVPTFWLGLNLMFIFAVMLRWFPSSGFPSVIESGNWSNLRYLILPCLTLAAPNSALIIRLTRSSMLDVIREDHVRTARAKGLPEWKIILKHVFRNALISIVSALGFTFVALVSGTVVTETVFSLPGIGRLVVESILRRDYPVIQGIILVIVLLYMLINLLVDLSYAFLDPRIKYS
ncbi:ABC transporter permease [Acetomicrobium sp. S15 = DSM 107314]|uniref:ABC transporter permease n=1 Tax=Acetomicrobium sp. S15 = DSM 107314 TaxID=2529858 RepID=UPI00406BEE25